MNFLPNTDQDRKEMLKTIGVDSIDDLFSDIPSNLKLKNDLNIPPALSEYELAKHMEQLASKNTAIDFVNFIGAGSYDHYIPSVVKHMWGRSEFYTAYTPYQAEISQAVLQSIYEYQTMICELTGMVAANASMYDGASAAAESVTISSGLTRRKRALVSSTVHPETRAVINTYANAHDIQVEQIDYKDGVTDVQSLADKLSDDVACVVVQQPNFFGLLEPVDRISSKVKDAKATFVVSVNPMSLGLLRPPAEYGADIVVGEGQVFGNPMSFGGPYLGIMAVNQRYLRRMPGRLVGMTSDSQGRRGFVLTLQTREQHIRRERATSNICSNQALNALAATVYMSWVGKEGIKEVGEHCLQKAAYLAGKINEIDGFSVAWEAPFFNEFAVKCPIGAEKVIQALSNKKILAGYPLGRSYPELEDHLLIAVTEKRTKQEMDDLLAGLEGLV